MREKCFFWLYNIFSHLERLSAAVGILRWKLINDLRKPFVIRTIAGEPFDVPTAPPTQANGAFSMQSDTPTYSTPSLYSSSNSDDYMPRSPAPFQRGQSPMSEMADEYDQVYEEALRSRRTSMNFDGTERGASLTINGIPLSDHSDFVGCDEEAVATALGDCAQLIQLLATYLGIPLRYTLYPCGSRSTIVDEINSTSAMRYPLYSRGSDQGRFAFAVFLLNCDIAQVRNSLGKDVTARLNWTQTQSALQNLNAILQQALYVCSVNDTASL